MENQTNLIELQKVTKGYNGEDDLSLDQASLSIRRGEVLVIIGASGSGKTTLLKILNGLEKPTSGNILIKGKSIESYDITHLRRSFYGYVFQKVGLFPHMTIEQNLAIVLKLEKKSLAFCKKRVLELLELIHLDTSCLERYPDQLSGGEQQRVGVARALATDSECLLMDEPFGALDAVTRCALQDEILSLRSELNKTIIFITHDIGEAFKLGDRIAVMREGKIEQVGTKRELTQHPKSPFVKELVQTGLKAVA